MRRIGAGIEVCRNDGLMRLGGTLSPEALERCVSFARPRGPSVRPDYEIHWSHITSAETGEGLEATATPRANEAEKRIAQHIALASVASSRGTGVCRICHRKQPAVGVADA